MVPIVLGVGRGDLIGESSGYIICYFHKVPAKGYTRTTFVRQHQSSQHSTCLAVRCAWHKLAGSSGVCTTVVSAQQGVAAVADPGGFHGCHGTPLSD